MRPASSWGSPGNTTDRPTPPRARSAWGDITKARIRPPVEEVDDKIGADHDEAEKHRTGDHHPHVLGLDGPATLLRPGGIALEDIAALIGPVALYQKGEKLTAPGQLASHYAPAAPLRLNAQPEPGDIHIGFGPGPATLNLSSGGNLTEAAANLFHMLREADQLAGPKGRISAAPIPDTGLGRAINDRLARAAAPRP